MGLAAAGFASAMPSILKASGMKREMPFKLALSQFSLAGQFWTKQLDPLDFPKKTITAFGITGLDYCSMFFADKARDANFLNELKKRSADNGCYNLRVMVDGEGVLGDLKNDVRTKAVENHYKWIDAAAVLGCPMIRVNVEGEGDPQEVRKAAIAVLGDYDDTWAVPTLQQLLSDGDAEIRQAAQDALAQKANPTANPFPMGH